MNEKEMPEKLPVEAVFGQLLKDYRDEKKKNDSLKQEICDLQKALAQRNSRIKEMKIKIRKLCSIALAKKILQPNNS